MREVFQSSCVVAKTAPLVSKDSRIILFKSSCWRVKFMMQHLIIAQFPSIYHKLSIILSLYHLKRRLHLVWLLCWEQVQPGWGKWENFNRYTLQFAFQFHNFIYNKFNLLILIWNWILNQTLPAEYDAITTQGIITLLYNLPNTAAMLHSSLWFAWPFWNACWKGTHLIQELHAQYVFLNLKQ